jgi:hypothetical protein
MRCGGDASGMEDGSAMALGFPSVPSPVAMEGHGRGRQIQKDAIGCISYDWRALETSREQQTRSFSRGSTMGAS